MIYDLFPRNNNGNPAVCPECIGTDLLGKERIPREDIPEVGEKETGHDH